MAWCRPAGHTSGPRKRPVTDTKRIPIALCCSVCSARNYKKTKPKAAAPERFALKKHCPHCKRHTVHRESK